MVLGQCEKGGSHPGRKTQEVRAWAKEQSEPAAAPGERESKGPRVLRLMVSSGAGEQVCGTCQRVKN